MLVIPSQHDLLLSSRPEKPQKRKDEGKGEGENRSRESWPFVRREGGRKAAQKKSWLFGWLMPTAAVMWGRQESKPGREGRGGGESNKSLCQGRKEGRRILRYGQSLIRFARGEGSRRWGERPQGSFSFLYKAPSVIAIPKRKQESRLPRKKISLPCCCHLSQNKTSVQHVLSEKKLLQKKHSPRFSVSFFSPKGNTEKNFFRLLPTPTPFWSHSSKM